LSLRRTRRLAGVLTTIPTTLLSLASSGAVLLTQPVDPTTPPMLGIDPVYLYAAATLACGGLGYLVGPSIGTFFWNVVHKRDRKNVEAMDSVFWSKIERNRVDPSRQTMQNRLPDFYGEKIASIPQYRQWLRDQAAFRRKTSHGVRDDLTQ
ncbi:mitochondrial import protein Pam17, partial [Tilletiopsis washingtonensis]